MIQEKEYNVKRAKRLFWGSFTVVMAAGLLVEHLGPSFLLGHVNDALLTPYAAGAIGIMNKASSGRREPGWETTLAVGIISLTEIAQAFLPHGWGTFDPIDFGLYAGGGIALYYAPVKLAQMVSKRR